MKSSVDWTGPEEIRAEVSRLWDQGKLLAARARGEPLFPVRLRFRGPGRGELGSRFEEVRQWIRRLDESARTTRGFGYEIEWTDANLREVGRNRIPDGITIPTEDDALRIIQKLRTAERFQDALAFTVDRLAELRDFFADRPMQVLENLDVWPRLVDTVRWFKENPRSGLYLRQLEIPGVDTKLIEAHRGILSELLARVVAGEPIEGDARGRRAFEQRYGLLSKPALIRLRILDPSLTICGLTDLSVVPRELSQLALRPGRVFITENEVNGLAFPQVPGAIVIFGLGYSLERLNEVRWLHHADLHYWGDIDTHGFAILDLLRSRFPQARSLLMDRETLLAHRALWGRELPHQRHLEPLTRLTAEENAVFEDLRKDALAEAVRLEQERISFTHVRRALGCSSSLSSGTR